jgi:hypothetical protein
MVRQSGSTLFKLISAFVFAARPHLYRPGPRVGFRPKAARQLKKMPLRSVKTTSGCKAH